MGRLEQLALRWSVVRVAAVLAAGIGATTILGALEYDGAPLALFDLDGEGKPPALLAGFLTGSAGVVALLVHRVLRRRSWLVLGGVLVFMALDELLTVHEQLQSAVGVEWQVLYLPIFAAVLVVGLLVLRDLRAEVPYAGRLMFLGAASWALAQVCEQLEYDDGGRMAADYAALATLEEFAEMFGSLLFLCAFLLVLRAVSGRGASDG